MAKDEINAFLGVGTSYQGKLNFQGSVRIDGHFDGEVFSEGTLVVGQEAEVEGTLNVGQLVLSGTVKGTVFARERVVLHRTANMQGGVNTPSMVMEEGARMDGKVLMSTSPEESGGNLELGEETGAAAAALEQGVG
jgi:cytoskeletal protein CcmA (bactofilin family)